MFSSSFVEARSRFLAAAGTAGAAVRSIPAPGYGPGGETLHLDVAALGDPDAPARLIVSCGLHGIEGYCGSAIQTGWLSSGGPAQLPSGLAVIMVHALNPYGFAWGRRFNEDNIDLNRNFLGEPWEPPVNLRYREVRDALTADPGDAEAYSRSEAWLDDYRRREGEAAYAEAVAGGQYDDPHGLFFGGHGPAWTNRTVVALYRELLAGAGRAVIFDIHTGIGDYAELVHFAMMSDDDDRLPLVEKLFSSRVRTPARGPDGGRARRGLMMPHLDSLGLAPLVLPCGIEFGTYPLDRTTAAVRAETAVHLRGLHATPQGRRAAAEIREAFAPRSADWEHAVLTQSAALMRDLVAQAASL